MGYVVIETKYVLVIERIKVVGSKKDISSQDFELEQAKIDAKKNPKQVIGKLAELLERSGIDVEEIGVINRVNVWQGFYKDADGEAHKVDMAGVQLTPAWAQGPQWPVVQQAKPTIIKTPSKSVKKLENDLRVAVVLPDVQIGYRMFKDGSLDPFHDEKAMSVALKLTSFINPDRIVNLGDLLDFPAQGKYIQEPTWAATTQHGLDRAHQFLAEQRAAAPNALIHVLEGNHDKRLTNNIMINASYAFGLQRANMPESWPVMSVPFLLRFDELSVEYVPGYPANATWLNDNLRCIHGVKVKSAGSTAALVIDDERVSSIFGHVHRIELKHKTRQVKDGAKFNFAATLGCLCRLDGAVPGVKSGIDLMGRPLPSYADWQQSIGVVTYEEGDGKFALEIVPIHNGTAIYRGKVFEAEG
jgi:hypothetical protein